MDDRLAELATHALLLVIFIEIVVVSDEEIRLVRHGNLLRLEDRALHRHALEIDVALARHLHRPLGQVDERVGLSQHALGLFDKDDVASLEDHRLCEARWRAASHRLEIARLGAALGDEDRGVSHLRLLAAGARVELAGDERVGGKPVVARGMVVDVDDGVARVPVESNGRQAKGADGV